MHASVILSTYNSPEWLAKVIWGYQSQSDRDFELLIADDGSNETCRGEIQKIAAQSSIPIRHIWQKDRGFRKTLILNKALRECRFDYVIFSDGDCIPRSDFISTHKRHAERNRYLSGGYIKLPMPTSRLIRRQDIQSGGAFRFSWLRKRGLNPSRKNLKIAAGRFSRILDFLTTTRPTLNGQNSSAWKADLYKANGFDNRMAYGGEDSELGLRLNNLGVMGKQIRYSAVCIHLDHSREYVNELGKMRNESIRQQTIRQRIQRTPSGLAEIEQFEACPGDAQSQAERLLKMTTLF